MSIEVGFSIFFCGGHFVSFRSGRWREEEEEEEEEEGWEWDTVGDSFLEFLKPVVFIIGRNLQPGEGGAEGGGGGGEGGGEGGGGGCISTN